MIRKIALGVATALLVIGLPVAALGVARTDLVSTPSTTQDQTVAATAPTAETAATDQAQTQARRQLRIHAETGVPEGTTPTQTRQRLHTQDQTGTQALGTPQAKTQGRGHAGGAQGVQPGDGTGNQFGRNGDGHGNGDGMSGNNTSGTPGECTNPDGPIGSGPGRSANS